ncbi:MAG: hypothetical protein RDU76_08085 [Candidatus Edwardsbacteria bacterium]|nr:hypothetical protein [Candidatus Edwardsbacteria bacterium]
MLYIYKQITQDYKKGFIILGADQKPAPKTKEVKIMACAKKAAKKVVKKAVKKVAKKKK